MNSSPISESAIAGAHGATGPQIDAGTIMAAAAIADEEVALTQARQMLKLLRVAHDLFPSMRDLADHPGWEMLLHLFIAGKEGRSVTTVDLCEMTGTWRPLAVRYIEMLCERGLIDRDVSAERPEAWALGLSVSAEMRLQALLCSSVQDIPFPEGDSKTA